MLRGELGYLTHVAGRAGAARAYRDTIALAVAAEEHGFGTFWIAQHHAGSLQGLLPSPLVLLAAVAQHTSRIRLGTAVVAAALEDPIRLAEDAAVVDELSGGRLELGIGAGADADASAAFGRDHSRRHADCAAVLDALCAQLTGPDLVPAAPSLRQRLWWATGSAAGVDAAATRGIGVLTGRPGPEVGADLSRYWTRAAGDPRVAACRIVAAGERPAALLDRWRDDPVRPWATQLVVQTQPADADLTAHLATLRTIGAAARDTSSRGAPTRSPVGAAPARDRPMSTRPLVRALRRGAERSRDGVHPS